MSSTPKIFEKDKTVVSSLILANLKKAVDAPNALDKAHYATQAFFLLSEEQQKFLGKETAETLYYCSNAIRNVKVWKYNFLERQKEEDEKSEYKTTYLRPLPAIPGPTQYLATLLVSFYRIEWPFKETKENYARYIKPWCNEIPESVTTQGSEEHELFFSASHGLTRSGFHELKSAFSNYAFVASLNLVNRIANLLGEELLPLLSEGEKQE
jgi:hypothetical protein